jgi:hypothetical protein
MFLASFLLLPSSLSLAQLTEIFSGGSLLLLLPFIFTILYHIKSFHEKNAIAMPAKLTSVQACSSVSSQQASTGAIFQYLISKTLFIVPGPMNVL